MTTLLPFVLGLAMLSGTARRFTSQPPSGGRALPQIPGFVGTSLTPIPGTTDQGRTR